MELPGVDHIQEVQQELYTNIAMAKSNKKKGIKAQKVSLFYFFLITNEKRVEQIYF